MLSPDQSAYVAAHFNVYEHNWQFYEELLGESLLLDDVITYCDGSGLYLAAFALKESGFIFEPDKIAEYMDRAIEYFAGGEISFINIWGQFTDLPEEFVSGGRRRFCLFQQSEFYCDMFDSIFDVSSFDDQKMHSANRRIRALARKKIHTTARKCAEFSHEHFHIIRKVDEKS